MATALSTTPYDGHHRGATTPGATSIEEEVTVTPSRTSLAVQLSTFRPIKDNINQDDDEVLEVALQHDETATFIGEYEVSVVSGVITVYGAVLRSGSFPKRIYAPSTLALPQIQARQQNTMIRISSVKSTLRKLDKLSPLFRNIWVSSSSDGRSFALLSTAGDDLLQRSMSVLDIGRETDTVLRTLSAKALSDPQRPRIMAVGAKSSGKSTFNRVLCNHLHSWTPAKKVLYLDLDPGQPEFGPPRQISLVEVNAPVLGPAFTHSASVRSNSYRLIRSHAIAATTYREDPELYKTCAVDLIKYADARYPLIVNSCGWVTGLGATILADFTSTLGISDIILLEPLDTNLVITLRMTSNDVVFHRIPRQPPRPSSRTHAETRAMMTMAYFHHRPAADDGISRWSGKPMNTVRPWMVSYAGSDQGIFAVMFYGQSPNPEFLAEVLDGSVIAISIQDHNDDPQAGPADEDLAAHVSRTLEDIPYITPDSHGLIRTLDPGTSHCVGFAFVRGINTIDKELQLVTPLRESDIAALVGKRVVLIRCGSDPPEWAYLEELYKDGGNASFDESERPWVSKKGMVGVEGAVWRLRHPPMASTVIQAR